HNEREIIERVFEFNDLKARDVMTPKGKIFALDGKLTVAAALPQLTSEPFSRIPLYTDQPDNFVRVLYMRDVLNAIANDSLQVTLEDIGHKPLFVSQYQAIDVLFAMLRRRNRHFCIVVDEYGDVRGIVTLEDLLEELVGEIYDESDIAPHILREVSADEIIVEGSAELRVVEEYFDLELPGKPTDTVSLWVLNHTESIPQADEKFLIDGMEVTILEASSRNIKKVDIQRPADGDAAQGT
ncbi:MAG TPA: transporter associated domain-containing protein, partial [Gammaproteobacteria bacterium]|nr:transporter associated domain-containing protein [Gammaproteobacteria bacterium]